MTCHECELLLADGDFGEAVEQHMAVCLDCRSLARELQENTAALSAMRDEELVAPVLRPHRSRVWIAAAAAAVLLLAIASLWPRKSAPVIADLPPVQVAVARPELPLLAAGAPVSVRTRRTRPQKPNLNAEPAHEETILVKMLTPDPDVVVYWFIEPKERAE